MAAKGNTVKIKKSTKTPRQSIKSEVVYQDSLKTASDWFDDASFPLAGAGAKLSPASRIFLSVGSSASSKFFTGSKK